LNTSPNRTLAHINQRIHCWPGTDIHLPLTNYARLAGTLHPNSTLHFYWLTDWENKLPVYGNAEVWLKTRIQFENAMQKLDNLYAKDKNT
jgi:hypothetical protein